MLDYINNYITEKKTDKKNERENNVVCSSAVSVKRMIRATGINL